MGVRNLSASSPSVGSAPLSGGVPGTTAWLFELRRRSRVLDEVGSIKYEERGGRVGCCGFRGLRSLRIEGGRTSGICIARASPAGKARSLGRLRALFGGPRRLIPVEWRNTCSCLGGRLRTVVCMGDWVVFAARSEDGNFDVGPTQGVTNDGAVHALVGELTGFESSKNSTRAESGFMRGCVSRA